MARRLGIALLPRADHLRSAIRVQADVGGGRPLRPPLSEEGNLPHLTVFQGPFAETLVPERELERIGTAVSLPEEVRVSFTGVVHRPAGWVFLSLERTPLLETLQKAALTVLDPHLDRAAFDISKDTSRFSASERGSWSGPCPDACPYRRSGSSTGSAST